MLLPMAKENQLAPIEASSLPRCSVDIRMTNEQSLFVEILETSLRTQYDTRVLLEDRLKTSTEGRRPDIVLLDEDVRFDIPSEDRTRLVMLGKEMTDELIARCAEMNADGCLVTHKSGLADLFATMDAVMRGEWAYPQSMRSRMMELLTGLREETQKPSECPLTYQEKRILELVVDNPGIANKQIAKKLDISLYTAKNHMHSILKKLGTESRHSARDIALTQRWFSHSKI